MSLYNYSELSKYINGLRINLWHYMDKISTYIKTLTDPDKYESWYVELRNAEFKADSTKFSVMLVIGEKEIELQTVNVDKGLADGRIQLDIGGVWLDMSLNGNPIGIFNDISTIRLNNSLVIAPPALATYNAYRIAVGTGLKATYTPTTAGGTLTISIDRAALSAPTQQTQEGIHSIAGATPVDGGIIIQGSGDVTVLVTGGTK